ncbi:Zn-ribbon domain-containing OB-fold protein [Pyrofollis japonicus]|uniref:Zn-ribbon domain-containing OB-fold protein n=1 Tax=Pyrofollis japonicus TaxID=3060460 RepID=UPI00295A7BD6|nr:Zn-ribbon domain-containing OB-fold protein [Pyrofollis japonicus]BEP16760.1 Zn-ribbon domain-containing OB-fold protein [Pyrofollis japonicus]
MPLSISPARVWREREPRYRLVGKRCKKCGAIIYPPRPACPHCGSRDLEDVELPRTGTVETYTIIYTVMDGFRHKAPLPIAIVRLDNGLDNGARVLAPLTDIDPEEIKTGMRVEAVLRRIKQDGEHGLIAYGVAFRPVLSEPRK